MVMGGLNASDGVVKSTTSTILRMILNGGISQIVTESQKGGIGKRLPASKHYIAYIETLQGRKDLDIDMRRKTRAGRSSHWEIAIGGNPPLNSKLLHKLINSKEQFQ